MTDPRNILIKSKRLIDGTGSPPIEDAAILVGNGAILEVGHAQGLTAPPGTETIDLGERTIMPGIVDAHMHLYGVPRTYPFVFPPTLPLSDRGILAARDAREMLEAGITACRCLGSEVGPSVRRAIRDGVTTGPRMVASGEFIGTTGGTWDHVNLPLDWIRTTELTTDGPDGFRQTVRQRIREGANVIKIGLSKGRPDDRNFGWGDDPYTNIPAVSSSELDALVDEAHAHDFKVAAHAIGDAAVRMALDHGVDTIEHGYAITDETRKRLVDENALVVTTLCQMHFHLQGAEKKPDWLVKVFKRHHDAQTESFQKSLEAGVRFALGTDLVGAPSHPLDQAAKEFELVTSLGMDPMDAIVAGTKIASEALGMEDSIGTLELGKQADIIAFTGDPISDITCLQRVEFVMQGGKVIVDNH